MNMKEWKSNIKIVENRKDFFYWRNKAVQYFNLKPGEVIHHLMETDEQKEFNSKYYERWGFDFDGQMKYCVKMSKEDHDAYHVSLRRGKHNTAEHNKKVSDGLKKYYKTPEGELTKKIAKEKFWSRENAHQHQSEAIKKYFSNEENRKKLSDSMKGLKMWTNGEKRIWAHECPDGYWPCESPIKGKTWVQKNKIKLVKCIETGEVLNINEVRFKYPNASHVREAANGTRNLAGGYHWEWVNETETETINQTEKEDL